MLVGDVRQTKIGTWHVDIAAFVDDEEPSTSTANKTLKTATSRRRIPVHPELLAIGFLDLLKGKAATSRLFPGLKPDQYGNLATYALRRFRETFLPEAITLQPRQSFYSFRHSFRDALRRIDAQPATLQALGGWSQGALVSDAYGDQADPDYQAKFIAQVAFGELDLTFLKTA
jgi:integrase